MNQLVTSKSIRVQGISLKIGRNQKIESKSFSVGSSEHTSVLMFDQ